MASSLDKFDQEDLRELTYPVLVLSEGKSDQAFLMKLAEIRGIPSVHFSYVRGSEAKYPAYLRNLDARAGFEKLKIVAMVYDNDSDPSAAFAKLKSLLEPIEPTRYSLPTAPNEIGPTDADKVRVLLIPMPELGSTGALETLMLQSVAPGTKELECSGEFADCVGIDGWRPSHQAKMRLRSLITAACPGESDTALTYIWGMADCPVNLAHACFDPLVELLRSLA